MATQQILTQKDLTESLLQAGWHVKRTRDGTVLLTKDAPTQDMPKQLSPIQALLLGFGLGDLFAAFLTFFISRSRSRQPNS